MLGHAVVRQKRGCEDRRIGRGARRAGAVCTLSAQSRFLRGAIKKDSEYSRDPIKRLAKSSICLKRFTSHWLKSMGWNVILTPRAGEVLHGYSDDVH
jgi:hypothetical protein